MRELDVINRRRAWSRRAERDVALKEKKPVKRRNYEWHLLVRQRSWMNRLAFDKAKKKAIADMGGLP
jgi:hypothetical protein